MSLSSFHSPNPHQDIFVPYIPNKQPGTRKRKASDNTSERQPSEKKWTQNVAGAKSTSITSKQNLESPTQILTSCSKPVDDEVTEISHMALYYDERERKDKDKASNILENQSLVVVEGTNAFAADMTSKTLNPPPMDACVLELPPNCGSELPLSTDSIDFDVDNCHAIPQSMTTRNGEIPDRNGVPGSHRRNLRALSDDKGD
ncbi:hypothetical protein GGP41_002277 [Bipolaris sorokiniana]|uniref:Uncharacterized protein n=1 Tax=Cochliobolus sativus TaxID=45130 RepID=A0A8H5ZA17_COCSA|nr:hypothetical protein GGP41_002277 [Bipolaris sorokiniana]